MAYRKNVTDKEQNDIEQAADDSAIRLQWWKSNNGQTDTEGDTKFVKAYSKGNVPIAQQLLASGFTDSVIDDGDQAGRALIDNDGDFVNKGVKIGDIASTGIGNTSVVVDVFSNKLLTEDTLWTNPGINYSVFRPAKSGEGSNVKIDRQKLQIGNHNDKPFRFDEPGKA